MKRIINEPFKNDENRNEGENEERPHKVTTFKKEVFQREFHELGGCCRLGVMIKSQKS